MKNLLSPNQNALASLILFKLSSCAKISIILGSNLAFFSATSIMMPLSGAFAGIQGAFAASAAILILKIITSKALFSAHFLAFYIPGFFASLYWATPSRWLRAIPALIAIPLFIAHPIGSQAALYSLFWLIPVATLLFFNQSLFARALGSTVTAHAVGSVIWLYTIPMAPDQWLMLIPVVIVERLLFASGMVIAYKVCAYLLSLSSFRSGRPFDTHLRCYSRLRQSVFAKKLRRDKGYAGQAGCTWFLPAETLCEGGSSSRSEHIEPLSMRTVLRKTQGE
jgi:hypothetical protein